MYLGDEQNHKPDQSLISLKDTDMIIITRRIVKQVIFKNGQIGNTRRHIIPIALAE